MIIYLLLALIGCSSKQISRPKHLNIAYIYQAKISIKTQTDLLNANNYKYNIYFKDINDTDIDKWLIKKKITGIISDIKINTNLPIISPKKTLASILKKKNLNAKIVDINSKSINFYCKGKDNLYLDMSYPDMMSYLKSIPRNCQSDKIYISQFSDKMANSLYDKEILSKTRKINIKNELIMKLIFKSLKKQIKYVPTQ